MTTFGETPTPEKGKEYSILLWLIIAVITMLVLTSCGARKVYHQKNVTEEVTQSETTKIDSSKVVIQSDSNTKIIDTGIEEEFTIVPIDLSKKMVIEGKSFFNARISTKKVHNNKVIESNKKAAITAQNSVKDGNKQQTNKSTVAEIKQSDKKQFNFLNLWWLLLLIPIYFLWKKYRGLLPF